MYRVQGLSPARQAIHAFRRSRSEKDPGSTLGAVPSPEAEAYRDSFLNWARFNHRDLFNAACFVGVCAVLLLAGWGADHLFNVVFPAPKPVPACPTVAKCTADILAHPLHVTGRPSIPLYKPPTLTPTT